MKKENLGFTLIELLIVVLVIAALSGVLLGVINNAGVRAKARDAQRKADLKQIQLALEVYFADNRSYPNTGGALAFEEVDGSSQLEVDLEPNYMDIVPLDPTHTASTGNSGPCTNDNHFRYNYASDGITYRLTAIMEVTTSKDDSACNTRVGCGASYATVEECYYAQSP